MTSSQPPRQLSPRDREILRDVIVAYILSAEPVSSRSVSKQGRLGLSAATIRNVMADLEEWGYLAQPHTSAGRVPTRAAYHLFIESLMQARRLPARERRYIDESLQSSPADAGQIMESATKLLSELSHQVGIVVTPALGETVLKAIDFLPLSGRRVLCVVVSGDGFVDNKVIESEEELPREELVRIGNYLTENFAGATLREIRARLLALMAEERAQMDQLLARSIELARAGLSLEQRQGVLLDGTREVLNQPELADIGRVRRLFETFADKARLVALLSQCLRGNGVRVVIGDDSALTSELDFSLVATGYGVGERPLGALAIFGPSRMEYERVIPLVDYLGERLSRALAESFAGEART
ncbi:MAG TPA: heat-inducible transcriptional repressor HrcA [Thermoanaerobaculia bacterium]|nr:heat-inducible transcriptional repressor HrcA [Thermoanaerobaculia bacterium]